MKDHIRRILQIPPGSSVQSPNPAPPPLPPPPPPPPSVLTAPTHHRQITPPPKPAKPFKRKERNHGFEVEQAIALYLRESVDTFDLTKNTEVFITLITWSARDVISNFIMNRMFAIKFGQRCTTTLAFALAIRSSSTSKTRSVWPGPWSIRWVFNNRKPNRFLLFDRLSFNYFFSVQSPPYILDYEARSFNADYHIRFHTSDPNDNSIKTYLWPALVEGHNGPCLQKAVVITWACHFCWRKDSNLKICLRHPSI